MPKDKPKPPAPGSGKPSVAAPCASQETKTTGNIIDIVFDPDKSKKVTKCEKIVHVQFVRRYGDGSVIQASTFSSSLSHKDADTTGPGWCVDSLASETTPDYQQGTGDGKKNGGKSKATMQDAPKTSGGDKGFFDAATNPGGWKSHRKEFYAYAYCMKGPDCGKWYEGVHWDYTKNWEDQRDGKPGISKIINNNETSGPSADLLDAFNKFNTNKGFVPCK